MTVVVETIVLLDVVQDAGIKANLRSAIEDAQIIDWYTKWQPALQKILVELAHRGVPIQQWPQSRHWNWAAKTAEVEGLLSFKGYSVICNGVTQGLMRIDLSRTARLPSQKGKPLVYVDYLEVAPWNRSELGEPAQFRGVGTALVTAAIDLSFDEGFKGRIGLHALPQADRFYREICGMTDLGLDPVYDNRMRYFEMTPEQAQAFIQEDEG